MFFSFLIGIFYLMKKDQIDKNSKESVGETIENNKVKDWLQKIKLRDRRVSLGISVLALCLALILAFGPLIRKVDALEPGDLFFPAEVVLETIPNKFIRDPLNQALDTLGSASERLEEAESLVSRSAGVVARDGESLEEGEYVGPYELGNGKEKDPTARNIEIAFGLFDLHIGEVENQSRNIRTQEEMNELMGEVVSTLSRHLAIWEVIGSEAPLEAWDEVREAGERMVQVIERALLTLPEGERQKVLDGLESGEFFNDDVEKLIQVYELGPSGTFRTTSGGSGPVQSLGKSRNFELRDEEVINTSSLESGGQVNSESSSGFLSGFESLPQGLLEVDLEEVVGGQSEILDLGQVVDELEVPIDLDLLPDEEDCGQNNVLGLCLKN